MHIAVQWCLFIHRNNVHNNEDTMINIQLPIRCSTQRYPWLYMFMLLFIIHERENVSALVSPKVT